MNGRHRWFLIVGLGLGCLSLTGAEISQRQIVLNAMQQRPGDPWPRGSGHVILAVPGSSEVYKGYHEPGGSFSPGVGSFGVSIWLRNATGEVQVTSDSLPLDRFRQHFLWTTPRGLPAVETDSEAYRAVWSVVGPGAWLLQLTAPTNTAGLLSLAVRSVGPAGGPVQALDWKDNSLRINGRWTLTCEPAPTRVTLGQEGAPNWTLLTSTNHSWRGTDGWGFARLDLAGTQPSRMVIRDSQGAPPTGLAYASARSALELGLPQPEFTDCLNAQVAHLLMGLVGLETRPADPTSYPLPWLRHGAYVVTALARAGQLEVARQLCRQLAERDFFGGFGPEADAPGLALWALEEVSSRLRQPAFDRSLYPHMARKANLILEMMATPRPLLQPVSGPLLPGQAGSREINLVCDPARDGLILGKMDHQRPLLFVNAVSYQGLLSASRLAMRVGEYDHAEYWRTRAADLQRVWLNAFRPPQSDNDRTFICGWWPTWIAPKGPGDYLRLLDSRWSITFDDEGRLRRPPPWTYFTLAEAHQWLCLDRLDHVWDTIRAFRDHQASPGLFTWWENHSEENPARAWERVRGWVKPPHVTPQYWTAAEMLLLQLDVLAYLDESYPAPVLVIGAGVPTAWLPSTMRVRGLTTRLGGVDWFWQNGRMNVVLRGQRSLVRLGPAFPANTPLVVR